MTKKQLEAKVSDLERRLVELERRPTLYVPPSQPGIVDVDYTIVPLHIPTTA